MKNYTLKVFKKGDVLHSTTTAQSDATPLQVLATMLANGVNRYNLASRFKLADKGMIPGGKKFRLRFECDGAVLLDTQTDFSVISDPARIAKFEAVLGAVLAYRNSFLGEEGTAARIDTSAFPMAELRQRIEYRPAPAAIAPAVVTE